MTPYEELESGKALKLGLRLISYRPRSKHEIQSRLKRRFGNVVVQVAMDWLEEKGYIDDLKFANFWRQNRETHRPRGGRLIKYELLQRGVHEEVIDQVTTDLDEGTNAYRAATTRLPQLRGTDYITFRRRLEGYLNRRGFRRDTIRETIKLLWRECLP
jgi:regulatory protein